MAFVGENDTRMEPGIAHWGRTMNPAWLVTTLLGLTHGLAPLGIVVYEPAVTGIPAQLKVSLVS